MMISGVCRRVNFKTQIIFTKMRVGNFEVTVPPGLSELLNKAGVWVIRKNKTANNNQYNRRVEKRNGSVVTILTKSSND